MVPDFTANFRIYEIEKGIAGVIIEGEFKNIVIDIKSFYRNRPI